MTVQNGAEGRARSFPARFRCSNVSRDPLPVYLRRHEHALRATSASERRLLKRSQITRGAARRGRLFLADAAATPIRRSINRREISIWLTSSTERIGVHAWPNPLEMSGDACSFAPIYRSVNYLRGIFLWETAAWHFIVVTRSRARFSICSNYHLNSSLSACDIVAPWLAVLSKVGNVYHFIFIKLN